MKSTARKGRQWTAYEREVYDAVTRHNGDIRLAAMELEMEFDEVLSVYERADNKMHRFNLKERRRRGGRAL